MKKAAANNGKVMKEAGDNMIDNFSEKKLQNDLVEEKLLSLKEEYQKPEMSKEQLDRLCQKMEEAKMENRKERNKKRMIKISAAAAVLVGAFLILPNTSATVAYAMEQIPVIGQLVNVVTFRDYQYETERNMADVEVPEIVLDNETTAEHAVQENMEQSTDEINAEIQEITDKLIAEFETNLKEEQGYQDVIVKSEVLDTTQDYFTLKLICYQGAGSGYEWHYYYTIDLKTGERLQMRDIFKEGTDFITPISENIKKQMQEQMSADENVMYWLNDEIEEWNFKSITEETSFYLNENGHVVICFDEGEVAPMYMGCVEFEIPAEVLADIRK